MGDLTKNFSRSEFACKCGCGFDDVKIELVQILQKVREHFGAPVRINSACRCVKHNSNVGGSPRSFHLSGMAADIVVVGFTPAQVYQFINETWPQSIGLIQYSTFTHVDVRGGMYRKINS